MRTITYDGAVSLDGFLAGIDGSLDWLHFSKDVQQIMTDYWKDVDTILMGRKTYEVSVAQHPPAKKIPRAPSAARKANLPCAPTSFRAPSNPSMCRARS
jgi:dihydrofolate reductase